MKISSMCIAYKEERFIEKHLRHLPKWIDNKLVLISRRPWFGESATEDKTYKITTEIKDKAIIPIQNVWSTEHDQRNTALEFSEYNDWVIVLDPDEFLTNKDWDNLYTHLSTTTSDAVIVEGQYTYWKNGYVADPPKDYPQLIAVRPHVRFIDKRVVNSTFDIAPVWIHHFSWARTDEEIWNKISHYAHANDFDVKAWYNNVWKQWKPGMKDVHPTSPNTLHELIPAKLPPELERLRLWPK